MLRKIFIALNIWAFFCILSPVYSAKKTIELKNIYITNEGPYSRIKGEYYTWNLPYDLDQEKYNARYYVLYIVAGDGTFMNVGEAGGPSPVNTSECSWYSCVATKWEAAHGASGSFDFEVYVGAGTGGVKSVCFYGADGYGGGWSSVRGWTPAHNPGGDSTCTYSGGNGGTVVYKDWCALYSDAPLSFDFGTVDKNETLNVKKSNNLKVYCTYLKKYQVKLKESIVLSNGMNVVLKADGKGLGTNLNGIEGTSTIELSAELSGTPQKKGVFTGKGVLYISMP